MSTGSGNRGVRKAAVSGRFYPADPDELEKTVRAYLSHAEIPNLNGIRAVIAPHAGYACSGPVAGHSFQALRNHRSVPLTVFLAGPAHWVDVQGIGLTSARFFETPLGRIEVDLDITRALLESGPPFVVADEAHAPEHCLEVELPFLQISLEQFRIVPMLFGSHVNQETAADRLADVFEQDENSVLIVSSDLSHYLTYKEAHKTDAVTLEKIVTGDRKFVATGQACGREAIMLLILLARRFGWTPLLLAYANSGDTCSTKDRVVGYGSIAYTDKPFA